MSEELMERKTFVFYRNWATALLEMPNDMRLIMMDAILKYFLYNETPGEPLVKMAFELYRQKMDDDAEAYLRKVATNRTNGANGGRPKKPNKTQQNPTKPNGFLSNPTKADGRDLTQANLNNDNENDKENVNNNFIKDIKGRFSDEKRGDTPNVAFDEFVKGFVDFYNEAIPGSWGSVLFPPTERRMPKIKNLFKQTKGSLKFANAIIKHAIINAESLIENFSPKKAFDQILNQTNIYRVIESFKEYANDQNTKDAE